MTVYVEAIRFENKINGVMISIPLTRFLFYESTQSKLCNNNNNNNELL